MSARRRASEQPARNLPSLKDVEGPLTIFSEEVSRVGNFFENDFEDAKTGGCRFSVQAELSSQWL
jgi:hypothetical protein